MRVTSISIVTPCRNAEHLIGQTVESIYNQTAVVSGRVKLEYIVCDGASTDSTVEVVRRASAGRATIISERDRGMYDAVAKGLRRTTGDVVAYLNAGDMYYRTAFDVVADVFEFDRVEWLTGMVVLYNPKGHLFSAHLPYKYRRKLIRRGLYGTRVLPFIQQESTFWSRRLHDTIDWDRLIQCKYAGDYFLWKCMANAAELTIVDSFLGGFLYHPGQASENMEAYRSELRSLADPRNPLDYATAFLDRVLWYAPAKIKKRLNPRWLFQCRRGSDQWM